MATMMVKWRGDDALSSHGEGKRTSPRRASFAVFAPALSTHGTRSDAVTPPECVLVPCTRQSPPESLGGLRGCWIWCCQHWCCREKRHRRRSVVLLVWLSQREENGDHGRHCRHHGPATSRTVHRSSENPLDLLHETTEVTGKGGFGIERNGTSHLTLHVSRMLWSRFWLGLDVTKRVLPISLQFTKAPSLRAHNFMSKEHNNPEFSKKMFN